MTSRIPLPTVTIPTTMLPMLIDAAAAALRANATLEGLGQLETLLVIHEEATGTLHAVESELGELWSATAPILNTAQRTQ